MLSWQNVLGRVAFANCDPIFDGLEGKWKILPAPPSWLTGHVLRRDCLTAPIPTADYANHAEELSLIKGLGIISTGDVGSVLLFGSREIESMRDIALPSDSSTSQALLKWILSEKNHDPKYVETGPDFDFMMENHDGALLIGDRAMIAAKNHPELVKMDLGAEWTKMTGFPMVYGVFATRHDSPKESVRLAQRDMIEQYRMFQTDESWREKVINRSSIRNGMTNVRLSQYFESEVLNELDSKSEQGLIYFLNEVCGMESQINWFD